MTIFDFFPLYETYITPRFPQELLAHLNFSSSGAMLDAGGGTGRIAQFTIAKANPTVVADLSHKMLSEARQKDGQRPVYSYTETPLPFPDATSAYIIGVDALHHACDQRKTMDELWRALQPGGRLVIEEPDLRQFGVKLLGNALARVLIIFAITG